MNSFSERFLAYLRHLAIKPVLAIIGIQLVIFITIKFQPQLGSQLTANNDVFAGEVWRLLTAVFSHQDSGHFIFNTLFFLMVGRWFFEVLGNKLVYLIIFCAGIGTNLLHLLIYDPSAILGFSGAFFALLAATCARDPHRPMLFFPAWIFVAVLVFLQFLGFLNSFNASNGDTVAYDAHLFGAIIGYCFIALKSPLHAFNEKIKDKRAIKEEIEYSQDLQRFDQLLQKISDKGLHTLTDEERVFLKKHSERERRRKAQSL